MLLGGQAGLAGRRFAEGQELSDRIAEFGQRTIVDLARVGRIGRTEPGSVFLITGSFPFLKLYRSAI